MHENCHQLFIERALWFFRPYHDVLEIGPEGIPSRSQQAAAGQYENWHTADLVRVDARQTYLCDGEESMASVPSSFYDIVFSTQVIEHVRRPWLWIREVARVCKPDGLVITICPISWPYHEVPIDCWRIYPEGMRALYAEAGLAVCLADFASLHQDGVVDSIAVGRKKEE
jgi:SAM-dependent methyltransferase